MTRSVYQFYTRLAGGEVVPSAEVKVNFSGGGEAPIYDAENGGNLITQPLIGTASGKAVFYIEPGIYDVESKDPVSLTTSTFSNEEIGTTREALIDDNQHAKPYSDLNRDPLINDLSQAYEFKTLQEAVDFDKLVVGKVCHLAERTTGNGGGAMWDAVLASSVTPNTYNIVQCVGNPTIALVLRYNRTDIDALAWGMVFNGVANDTLAFTHILTEAQDGVIVKLPEGETVIDSVWIRAGVAVEGASRRGTTIKANTSENQYCIGLTQSNCALRNVTIDGSGSMGFGLLWSGVKSHVLEEVKIIGFTNDNPGFLDGFGMVCEATYSNRMVNCEITGNRSNILFRNNGELNVFTADNCTLEYSAGTSVIMDKGWNVNFESCSFGHHGVDPDWEGTAIKVTDPEAQVCVNNTWFEWCFTAIEFAGKNLEWANNHTVGKLEVSSGTATISENQFFGFGSFMTVPTGTSGKIVQWNNNHSVSQGDMIQDPDGKVFEAVSEVVKYVTATLTPETSGTISLFASEDSLTETVQGSIVSVQGRLTLSATSSPNGSYIELGGLTYQAPSFPPEKSEFASGSCVFYNASGAARTIEGIDIQGNGNPRIWIPASSVENNDTLTINLSYKFK